jgi:acyl-coenzyme A synthetase/AMP-(fatty) acid ligase
MTPLLASALRSREEGSPVVLDGAGAYAVEALLADARALAAGWTRGEMASLRTGEARQVAASLVAAEHAACPLLLVHPWVEPAVTGAIAPPSTSDGPAILLMTSGTTGAPKVAVHSLASLTGRIQANPAPDARWLLTFAPTTFAGVQVLLSSLLTGATLVAPDGPGVEAALEAAQRHGVTHVSATPTFWRALLLAPGVRLPALQQITLGGERADQRTLDALRQRFPQAQVTHLYASTEAGALFAVRDGQEGFPAAWLDQAPAGLALRVRDDVLEVRSPRAARGYASAHDFPASPDGWLSTGDRVTVSGGRVRFAGRLDGLLNVGGYKVDPAEVERVIDAAPGVAHVRVFGVPSPLAGTVLAAEVTPVPGADPAQVRTGVLRAARAGLEAHQVPRVVRVASEVTVDPSGKKSRGG